MSITEKSNKFAVKSHESFYNVDVIIPAYLPSLHYLQLLRRALSSLEVQTYTDFGISLVLNGSFCSADEILSSLQSYKYFDRITLYDMGRKASGAAARNYGIIRSTSKYIAQLDADDMYMPEKLEKQVEYMDTHSECDFLGTCLMVNSRDGQINEEEYDRPEYHKDIAKVIERENAMACGSIIFRNDVFCRFGVLYTEAYKPGMIWPSYGRNMHEDWDLWIRLIKAGAKTHNLQEKLYVWSEGTSVAR